MTPDRPRQQTGRRAEWRVGVLSGVIASVLVLIFVEPRLELTWRVSSVALSGIATDTIDGVYRSAALGHRNHAVVRVVVFLAGLSVGALTSLTVTGMLVWRRGVGAVAELAETRRRPMLVMSVLSVLLVVGGVQMFAATLYADLQYVTSFEQQLTILAPGIDEQLEEELRAQWASMSSRADYLGMNSRMELVADSVGIELPPRLLR